VGVQRQVQLRDSKQPGRPFAFNSISNSARERPIVGWSERVYESTKLAALFDMLIGQGCPSGEILKNVNLTVEEVHSPKSRISLAELMTACENAIRLSGDPHLPYRIGTSIHISAYGMYGFAILCCPDFRKAMSFAELYHTLAAPLAAIEFGEEDGLASWIIEPNARAAADPRGGCQSMDRMKTPRRALPLNIRFRSELMPTHQSRRVLLCAYWLWRSC